MKLSVVVPVYKVEKYLARCIESILEQSFADFELILVDDGSPDRCPAICDEYAQKDDRIKVIHQTNRGLSSARNAGIECASGEYIAFIDSDDFISKNMFSILMQNALDHQADISGCSAVLVAEDAEAEFTEQTHLDVYERNEAVLQMVFFRQFSVNVWNKIFRRALFSSIRYPEGMLYEDLATMYRLIDQSNIVVISDAKLYAYVQRSGSIMNRTGYMMEPEKVVITDDMVRYFSAKEYFTHDEKEKILAGGVNSLLNDIYKMASRRNLKRNARYTEQLRAFDKHYSMAIKDCRYLSGKSRIVLWSAANAPGLLDAAYGRLRAFLRR